MEINLTRWLGQNRRALVAFAIASLMLPGAATAQTLPFEQVEEEKVWRVDVGGGTLYGFNPGGGRSDQFNLTAWGSASYKDRIYANGLDGLGYNIIKQDDFRLGVQLRPAYGSESDLEGLELPGFGADATIYAFKRVPGNIVVGGRLQRDVTDVSDGTRFTALVSKRTLTRVGLLSTTGYVRGGNARSNMAYLGITQAEADATDYEYYEADGGATAAGAAMLIAFPILDNYAVGSFINYERALGPAADSPLVLDSKNEEDTFRFGLLFVRRFESVN